jgi:hypothetical protein
MNRLDETRLTESLGRLPRYQASADFADTVMLRLEDRSARGFFGSSALRWVMATVIALAIGIWVSTTVRDHQREQLAYKRKVDAIRSQYQQIQTDVRSLRREAATSPTVVYLGGNERFDLVLDLADLAAYESAARRAQTRVPRNAQAQPASYQP